jgi:hypothetical protein
LITAAQVLQPEALAAKLLRPGVLPDDVELWAWVAHHAAVALYAPPGAARACVTLELKQEQLHRLLLGRLNLAAALDADEVTLRGAGADMRDAVARAFPWARWAYHAIEFI